MPKKKKMGRISDDFGLRSPVIQKTFQTKYVLRTSFVSRASITRGLTTDTGHHLLAGPSVKQVPRCSLTCLVRETLCIIPASHGIEQNDMHRDGARFDHSYTDEPAKSCETTFIPCSHPKYYALLCSHGNA